MIQHPAAQHVKRAIARMRDAATVAGGVNLAPYMSAAEHRAQIEGVETILREAADALIEASRACARPQLRVIRKEPDDV